MASKLDLAFGRVCYKLKLVPRAELEDCLQELERRSGETPPPTLADVVQERGYLSAQECNRLLSSIRRKLERPIRTVEEETRGDIPVPPGATGSDGPAPDVPAPDDPTVDASSPIQPEDEGGEVIPGFSILETIGEGAMATVYKARHLSLDKIVAIKVLSQELQADPEYRERFFREARAAAKLDHPNVIRAYDVGEASGLHYFVMEYVEGHDLGEYLEEKGAMEEAQALRIVRQVALALEHAREAGITHRDIKPENVLVTDEGKVKLADLGLAKDINVDGTLTQVGMTIGTPAYFSPEQAAGREDLDTRSDIYSLGVTLYHILAGELPFDEQTTVQVMKAHLNQPPPIPHERIPGLSQATSDLIGEMLEKDRADRPQTPAELASAIDDVLAGRSDTDDGTTQESLRRVTRGLEGDRGRDLFATPDPDGPMAPVARDPRRPWMVAASALVLAVLVLFLVARSIYPEAAAADPGADPDDEATTRTGNPVAERRAANRLEDVARWSSVSDTRRLEALDDLIVRWAGTDAATEARMLREQIVAGLVGDAERRLREAAREADRHRRNEEWSRAIATYEEGLSHLGPLPDDVRENVPGRAEAEAAVEEILSAARAWAADRLEEVETLLASGGPESLARARSLAEDLLEHGDPGTRIRGGRLLAEVRRREEARAAAAREEADREAYLAFVRRIAEGLAEGSIPLLRDRAERLGDRLETEDWSARLATDRRALEALAELQRAAVRAVRGRVGRTISVPMHEGPPVEGELAAVSGETIRLLDEDGSTLAIPWGRVPPAWMLEAARDGWRGEPAGLALRVVLLAHYRGHHGAALDLYARARDAGAEVDPFRDQLDLHRNLVPDLDRGPFVESLPEPAATDPDPEGTGEEGPEDEPEGEPEADPEANEEGPDPGEALVLERLDGGEGRFEDGQLILNYPFRDRGVLRTDFEMALSGDRFDIGVNRAQRLFLGSGSSPEAHCLLYHEIPLAPPFSLTLTVEFERLTPRSLFGIVFGDDGRGSGYLLNFGVQLVRRRRLQARSASQTDGRPVEAVSARSEHTLRIEVDASGRARGFLDDEPRVQGQLDPGPTGYIGIHGWNLSAEIRRLQVRGTVDPGWLAERLEEAEEEDEGR